MFSQEDPFHLTISLNVDYNISSKNQDTFFYYEDQEIRTNIPLYHFRDPIRIKEDQNRLLTPFNVTIIQAEHSIPWDETDLINDIGNITYVASDTAPSFRQRLKGQLTSQSPLGIASFINTNYYTNPSHYITTDYDYFSGNDLGGTHVPLDDYPNFYLTDEYREMYGFIGGITP